jgi:hypothetical protein
MATGNNIKDGCRTRHAEIAQRSAEVTILQQWPEVLNARARVMFSSLNLGNLIGLRAEPRPIDWSVARPIAHGTVQE